MEWLQAILSLIGVLGLILVLFYYLKKLSKGSSTFGGKRLRIIDRVSVGRDSSLAVVSVCDKLILVGVSPQNVSLLSEIPMTENEYLSAASYDVRFSDVLSSMPIFSGMKKNQKNSPADREKCEGEIPLETNDSTSDEAE